MVVRVVVDGVVGRADWPLESPSAQRSSRATMINVAKSDQGYDDKGADDA